MFGNGFDLEKRLLPSNIKTEVLCKNLNQNVSSYRQNQKEEQVPSRQEGTTNLERMVFNHYLPTKY